MAKIRFTSPYARKMGTAEIRVEADTLNDVLRYIIERYPQIFSGLIDGEGKLTAAAVVFIQGRNAKTLEGAETRLDHDTDVLIVPFLSSG